MEPLIKKIESRTLNVGIVGLGYVGLPLACEFASANVSVTGFDLDHEKINAIRNGISYIQDVPTFEVANSVKKGLLTAEMDFSRLKEMDAISICVPTPLSKTKDPDMSYIEKAVHSIQENLRHGQVIVLESTTYPGTTEEVILPTLEETGLRAGRHFFLAFSPERVDPGNPIYKTRNTPKILGGITTMCADLAKKIYELAVEKVVVVSSTKTAEMVKLLENTFRSVNIAMANEMVMMCDKLGVDVWEVIDAAATKPFGFMPFYPGPGLGGHCIPIDPLYLSWKLKTLNYDARFIALAGEINESMPRYVVQKITVGLNDYQKSVKGSHVLILGVAYKANVNDLRESPALEIMEDLLKLGAIVHYHDQFVPQLKIGDKEWFSEALSESRLRQADCVVIVTNHDYFDMELIVEHSKFIVDTRNATKHVKKQHIVKI